MLIKAPFRWCCFIVKHKTEFLYICVFVLLQIWFYQNWNTLGITGLTSPIEKPIEPLSYKCCLPLNNSIRTNVFFLKTHKTGSMTVQSVLLRFAKLNSLDIMNMKYESYNWPLSDWSIHPNYLTPNGKYHILAHHTRYEPKLKSYQYPDTSMVTILRHPAKVFQSMFTYFKMGEFMGMSFEEFLNAPIKPSSLKGIDSSFAYRGYNQMSVDLGFDATQSKNQTAIDEFVEKIDREFDLVMITEQMEESMVLLGNLMGWPLEYVGYLNMNTKVNNSKTYELTLHDKNILMDLNEVDTRLYYHFLEKFRKCVGRYGVDKLNHQIHQLRIINQKLKDKCVAYETPISLYYGSLTVNSYVPKDPSDVECLYSTTMDWGINIPAEIIVHLQTVQSKIVNQGSLGLR